MLFNYEHLFQLADQNRENYETQAPFPHRVFDEIANPKVLDQVLEKFPRVEDIPWYKYDNALERKLAMPKTDLMDPLIRNVLMEMNSGEFIMFLERLTGISNLIPDPNFNGGGLHQILPGGKLDIHADYNYHRTTNLDRRLNVILYLNKDWREEYDGALELWDADMSACGARVLPFFNRMVVFSTTSYTFHGHPEPLRCPEGRTRKSIALYYYTNGRPEHEKRPPHSTVFKRRPHEEDDAEREALRQARAKGRLNDLTSKGPLDQTEL